MNSVMRWSRVLTGLFVLVLSVCGLLTSGTVVHAAGGGTVLAWGHHNLGHNSTSSSTVPVQVTNASGTGLLEGITGISGGEYHRLALRSDGTVWAWGSNEFGQLGDGGWITSVSVRPVQVRDEARTGFLQNVVAVSADYRHSVALRSDGTVWAWGHNVDGRLGDGTENTRNAPVQVKGPDGAGFLFDVVAVEAGRHHSMALKRDGTVWAWGYGGHGQLGRGSISSSNVPVQVKDASGMGSLAGIIAISAGELYNLALRSDGTVWAWGFNQYGILGVGDSSTRTLPAQVKDGTGAGFLSGITTISAGKDHNMALRQDGTVQAWGHGAFGQLGNGRSSSVTLPTAVKDAAGTGHLSGIIAMSAGHHYSLALHRDGTVWAWGHNSNGLLGDGTRYERYLPVRVKGLRGVDYLSRITNISAGYTASLAILAPPDGDNDGIPDAQDNAPGIYNPDQLPGPYIGGMVVNPDGTGVAGVTITRTKSGTAVATTATDAEGRYGFSQVPAAGSYTLRPAKSPYTFNPASRVATVSATQNALGIDFIALLKGSIAGRVVDSAGAGLSGVVVTRSHSSGSQNVATSSGGYYGFSNVPTGINTLTPGKSGFTFNPINRSVSASATSAVTAADFIGLSGTIISGRITNSQNAGVPGVLVKRSGSTAGVLSGSDGYYGFSDVPAGTYTILPAKSGLAFDPVSHNVSAGATGVNFKAFFTLSGKVVSSTGTALPGVTVTRDGPGTSDATTTTNSNGVYSFSHVPSGNNTVSVSLGGYAFSPASKVVPVKTASVSNANFTGYQGPAIVGQVTLSTGAFLAGVTVTRTTADGSSTASSTTDTQGYYGFALVPSGSHTVTPNKSGTVPYAFTPISRSVSVSGTGVSSVHAEGVNFTGYHGPSITGRITDASSGAGIAGVSVARTGSTAKVLSDAEGYYGFARLPATTTGTTYGVIPDKSGYSFSPSSRSATITTTTNAANVDFSGTASPVSSTQATGVAALELKLQDEKSGDVSSDADVQPQPAWSVSGQITLSGGRGVSGVWVNLEQNGEVVQSTTTESDGRYRFKDVTAGSYTVTPTSDAMRFFPPSREIKVKASDVEDLDFAATQPSGTR